MVISKLMEYSVSDNIIRNIYNKNKVEWDALIHVMSCVKNSNVSILKNEYIAKLLASPLS
jgi:hypothetical protein